MINWEVKKIFKSKNGIITLILFFILSTVMVFIKPQLEGGSDYKDKSKGVVSVEEQFNMKVELLREVNG